MDEDDDIDKKDNGKDILADRDEIVQAMRSFGQSERVVTSRSPGSTGEKGGHAPFTKEQKKSLPNKQKEYWKGRRRKKRQDKSV